MVYRCAHCRALLTLTDDKLSQCAEHPNGAVEWAPSEEVELIPPENPDVV
jgi:hypothetical protein